MVKILKMVEMIKMVWKWGVSETSKHPLRKRCAPSSSECQNHTYMPVSMDTEPQLDM